MSRAGILKDNAVFWDILKMSCATTSSAGMYYVVSNTIYYFNYIKPIRKLNKKTPVQFRLEQAS